MAYLVDFKNNTDLNTIQDYLSINNCVVTQVWNNFEKVYLVECDNTPPKTEIVESIIVNESVIVKPLNCFTSGIVEFDPYADTMYNPSYPSLTINTKDKQDWWKNYSLNTPEFDKDTVTISRKGKNTLVYIMDSGIDSSHPEFVGVDVDYVYSVTPNNFNDTNGHGTAIASIISGKTCGLTSSQLKIVKIFDSSHSTLLSEMLSALDAIINDVPKNTFAVVNCSWAVARNSFIESKMKSMIDRKIYVVASAGNNGTSIEDVTPAAMPEVLTIGSYNSDLLPSNFSNFTGQSHISNTGNEVNGGELDGWAPGEDIYCAKLNGELGFASGTSMACAVATAVLAYNLECYTAPDGTIIYGYEDTPLVNKEGKDFNFSTWCVRRPDLLDLSNEKYKNSKSLIATIYDVRDQNPLSLEGMDQKIAYYPVGESRWAAQVFTPVQTKSVEILTPLPENFCLNSRGLINGRPTADQGPKNNELYKLYTSKVKVEWKSGKINEIEIKIYVINSMDEVLSNSEIPDDHELKIQLQTAQCYGGGYVQFCYIAGYYIDCATTCFGGTCCNPWYGKSAICACA